MFWHVWKNRCIDHKALQCLYLGCQNTKEQLGHHETFELTVMMTRNGFVLFIVMFLFKSTDSVFKIKVSRNDASIAETSVSDLFTVDNHQKHNVDIRFIFQTQFNLQIFSETMQTDKLSLSMTLAIILRTHDQSGTF